jgi:hypothetical protein
MARLIEDYRRQRVLNGRWKFVTDPERNGRTNGWYESGNAWPDRTYSVDVPSAWQEDESYREYTGTAWYRRTELLDPAEDERVLLRFGAVDYAATVWVNGEQVGENRGGYLPFELDVTDAVIEGENTFVVEVVDPDDISEIPHGKQGAPWYQRISGVWQDVTLEFVPETRVERLRATPDLDDDTARIDLDVAGVDDSSSVTTAVRVTCDGDDVARGETVIDADGSGSLTVSIEDPTYWTPETPALYDVTVDLHRDEQVVDRYEDYFGMRSIEARDGQLYLNGEPYYMRGALDQGYYPETLYRPFSESLFEEEVRTAKELGFNLIRKHIKPAHPDFLECADRLGILVWEEPANPTVHTDRSKREVREQIEGLLERDYNRPSVIIWSLYNEEWGIGNPQGLDEETSLWEDEEKQAYLAELYENISARDPTRIICDNSGWAHVATDLNDYHRYFVSPDRAAAWEADVDAMTAAPEENYGATETDPQNAPIIVSEFGTWGLCDLPAIEDHYDGEPPWFDYDFFDDPIKRPAGVHDRLEETTLPDVFDDWESLAEAWQWREYRSIKDVIERMRAHEGVAGYVVTEFSDIEWEFNGILDYRREEKAFADEFARINDDVLVMIEPDTHAVGAWDTLTADIVVSNHTSESLEGEVAWSFLDWEGTVSVEHDGFGVTRLEDAVSIPVPDVDEPTTADLTVSLSDASSNVESITVVPNLERAAAGAGNSTVAVDDDDLASALAAIGFDVESSITEATDVALATEPGDDARPYVENGGTLVRLPDATGHMSDDAFFEYRDLPEDESWNLVASLFYRNDGPLETYVDTVPGWELEGLYPYEVVSDVDQDVDEVSVGYVEGWLANWSAAATVRDHGDGRVGAFTFRITDEDARANNPVGLAALAAFVTDLTRD